jgi:hypothetical protein
MKRSEIQEEDEAVVELTRYESPDYAWLDPGYDGGTYVSLSVGERKVMNHFVMK